MQNSSSQVPKTATLQERALHCLMLCDPLEKVEQTTRLEADWLAGLVSCQHDAAVQQVAVPGRPNSPELVAPRELTKRSAFTIEGRAALIHSLCHIEFNAINLALDAIYRFVGMPRDYYSDWLKVAREEAYHFQLLSEHLLSLGFHYGDFVAHNGLWEMAVETDHDVMVRMALVPRVMEARGLDVTPSIMEKLGKAGDNQAVAILEIIHRDEVGHVKIGTRWFRYVCEQRKLEPLATFKHLLQEYMKGQLRGPFDHVTRTQAGFTADELAYLEGAG
jgi:uncharacterized ferritin-like protein (DUF455 family)